MPRQLLQPGPIPLHHQVYLDLRAGLDSREWAPGERLPTERTLAAEYGCSLITVRRALDELVREGRLERTRGLGTFAKLPPLVRDLAQPLGFTDEMRPLGLHPYAVVVTARTEVATPAVGASLHLGLRASVHFLERVRGADGVPFLLEQAYLPAERFPGLLDEDYTTASLYEVLERRYQCRVTLTRETIAACLPSAREARLLNMPQSTASLWLQGIAYSSEVPVEFSRTIVSGERARYSIETVGGRSRSAEPIPDSAEGSAPGPEANRR
ncbi:MAG: GntR family transcriptional regulator [Candidatus Limnocylindrales bacterium]